jgi:transcription-repair coupling factor (superfamily II helicase)
VRGLGVLTPDKQLDNLIEWLEKMQLALPELNLSTLKLGMSN